MSNNAQSKTFFRRYL